MRFYLFFFKQIPLFFHFASLSVGVYVLDKIATSSYLERQSLVLGNLSNMSLSQREDLSYHLDSG